MFRKIFLSAGLLSCLATRSEAQLAYGLEAGIGSSNMYFAPSAGYTNASTSSILSWKFGQVADLQLNNNIFLQTGGYILGRGQTRKYSFYVSDSLNVSTEQTLKMIYAEVPLNIVFKTGKPGRERFFLGLGANFSYLIGGANKFKSTGRFDGIAFDSTSNNRAQNDDPVKGFDLGLNINGGYELPSGLFFRLYYTMGISDIGLGSEIDKNRNWGLSAGFLFGKLKQMRHESQELIDNSPVENEE